MGTAVNWFEVAGDDVDGLVSFYGDLFDLQAKDLSGTGYHQVEAEDGGIAGGIWDGAPAKASYAIFYFFVDDVDKSVKKAEDLGATILVPAQENGPVRFAHIEDPAGNRVGMYQPVG